jgi:hypothetical protein
MDSADPKLHSFVVKIWLEAVPDDEGKVVWHGYVTHVPGDERRYLRGLGDAIEFIVEHLTKEGVSFGPCERLCHWLRRSRLK